jgi:hypothetical protein
MPNVSMNIKSKRMKGNQGKTMENKSSPSLHKPSNNSKNITLHKSLDIDLYGVSSTNKIFPTWGSRNFKKKTSRLLWNMGFLKSMAKK